MFKYLSKTLLLMLFLLSLSNNKVLARTQGTAFNPSIGASSLFLFQNSKKDRADDGMAIQEMEIQLSSDVDTYFSTKLIMSIAPDGSGGFGISPEEAFAETISIPNFTFKIGKFKTAFGKHNRLHTHAFPFINAPYSSTKILSPDGFSDVGIDLSGLIPFLPWFSEYNLELLAGSNTDLFNVTHKHKAVGLVHLKNLWDVDDDLTMELGFSASKGKNDTNGTTTLLGSDITFKWKPSIGGKYQSAEWAIEFLSKEKTGLSPDKSRGIFSYVNYQFAQRWFAKYRFDYFGLDKSINFVRTHSVFLSFVPSEFSKIRWQYETQNGQILASEKRISMQFIINIGAHPSHSY